MTGKNDTTSPDTKVCSACGTEKPVSEYGARKTAIDGRLGRCRECIKADRVRRTSNMSREARDRLRAKAREYTAAYRRREYAKDSRWHSKQNRKHKYGLTLVKQTTLFVSQNGRCPICGEPLVWDDLAVDHDHATGRVRGLAHKSCNASLGHIEKYATRIPYILAYLGVELWPSS